MFVTHPLIKDKTLESRIYQEVIVASAAKKNTLVVAPTALGKTVIAILLSAFRLDSLPGSKILILSPTRPLVTQHANSFMKFLNIEEDETVVFTGLNPPEKRKEIFERARVICATPQVIHNDLLSGAYGLSDVSLLVFDEAHRATGDYPYAFIAESYIENAKDPLILALTASPGSDREKILDVMKKLKIENIEVRTEDDPDVKEYYRGVSAVWEKLELPKVFANVKKLLEEAMRQRLKELKELGFLTYIDLNIPKRELLTLRAKLQGELSRDPQPEAYRGISLVAGVINISHAIELLETQGLDTLMAYFERLQKEQKSKAVRRLLKDKNFLRALRLTENYSEKITYPKLEKLTELIKRESSPDKRIIIFTQYRDSANKIVETLTDMENIRPIKFVGQAHRGAGDRGLSQKKQLEVLEDFRNGVYNVLVATSVAEEGLDIPRVDLVIFYEPIPSEIRSIQRRGRTGRRKAGKVIVLMAKGTRDEGFYWSAKKKEEKMKSLIKSLKNDFGKGTTNIGGHIEEKQKNLGYFFTANYTVYVDTRELPSAVPRSLAKKGILSKSKRMEVGDYQISERVCIERKTTEDLLQSIMDKRLLEQVLRLKRTFLRPLLIVEGENLYSARNISPRAIRGVLASISVDFGVPILFSRDQEETAEFIYSIAERELGDSNRDIQLRGEKKVYSSKEMQELIVAGLPNINTTLAKRLLEKFGSVEHIFLADIDDLKKVKGIGKKTAEKIKEVITSKYIGD